MAAEDSSTAETIPTRTQVRMVVPDVARGVALLGIAVANLPTAWVSPGAPHAEFLGSINNVVDQVLAVLTTMFAHNRGLPLFTTLLGFGIGLIAMSLWRKQFPAQRARAIILRRYFFLAVFGALHLVLIFYGDIMFYYGISGMIIGLLLTVREKILAIISYVMLGLIFVLGAVSLTVALITSPDMGGLATGAIGDSNFTNFGAILQHNGAYFLMNLASYPGYVLIYFPIMLIGFTWARRGVLADVPSHRKELWAWAILGAVIILGVGLPWGLAAIGVLPEELAFAFVMSNSFIGALTGPALLAMAALALQPIQERVTRGEQPPVWIQVPMALGKRSMSGYLFQSIAFFIICYPIALGITPDSVTAQTALATAVWAVSLILAWLLEKANKRGPFEAVHRRLSYGPTMQPELKASVSSTSERH